MKIVSLTPGTGNFHCGGCLRDEALIKALRRLGHDAAMLPLYLPHVLDEPVAPEARSPVLFGGINVYLQQKSAVFRHTPRWIDRLFDGMWLLRRAAQRAGMTQADDLAELTLSTLRGEHGNQRKEIDRLIDHLVRYEKPDVVCLSNVLLIGLARRIRSRLNVPVVCTLQGEDSFLDSLPQPQRGEAWRLLRDRAADVDAFVAVSEYYRDVMRRRMAITDDRMHVVHNGIATEDIEPPLQPPGPPGAPTIGYLSRMCSAKGLHTLVDAFILLRQDPRFAAAQLRIAGAMTPADHVYVNQQRRKLADHNLTDVVQFLPNVDRPRKFDFVRSLSVLSVPATYGESFGLYLLEAWACGVPVVQPRHGAFVELLALTNGGILVAPDDAAALAEGLGRLLRDPQAARAAGMKGRDAVLQRFSAGHMAANFARVCELVRSPFAP